MVKSVGAPASVQPEMLVEPSTKETVLDQQQLQASSSIIRMEDLPKTFSSTTHASFDEEAVISPCQTKTDPNISIAHSQETEKGSKASKIFDEKEKDDILEHWVKEQHALEPSVASTARDDHFYDIEGLAVKQLPWTKDETSQVLAQLQFLQDDIPLARGINGVASVKIWKETLEEIRTKLLASIENGTLRRDDATLRKLRTAIGAIQLVDLDKLTELMQRNQEAGDIVDGKDVLLLCGDTGAGKTSTLQFFLGTSFEEVEVDGFLHLAPKSYMHWSHAQFKTSYSREPTTRSFQAATVRVAGKGEVAICDIPSYDVATCLEEDIALGMGMVQAIRRAKSVRPVVVLSREGMGNRFSNLPETMRIVRRLFPNVKSKADWKPFCYVFTKYDEKHRSLLHKQFTSLLRIPPKVGKDEQELFEAFIEDLAEKTNPDANIILPMEDHAATPLANLYRETEAVKGNPAEFCEPFVADFSLRQLQIQMSLTLHEFQGHILQENYPVAMNKIHSMVESSKIFPQMQRFVDLAKDQYLHQVTQIWVMVVRSIGKEDYPTALYRMEQLNDMAADFPDAVECSQLGHDLVTQSVTEPIAKGKYDRSICRMVILSGLESRFPVASDAIESGLSGLKEEVVAHIRNKNYLLTVDLVKQLGEIESAIPDAFIVAQHGLHLSRECLLNMIQEENYQDGIPLAKKIAELGGNFAEVNAHIRRIIKTLRKRSEQAIAAGEYEKAGQLLSYMRHLSDGDEHVRNALNSAAEHACELRMDVINAFETLLQVKEQNKYKKLLEHAHKAVHKLLLSEPMRSVCSDFFNTQASPVGKTSSGKPDYLTVLCTPKDCTSEAFVCAQVRHLVESLSAEFFTLEQESTSMEYMMEHRKPLLSVILRLRSTRTILGDCPGNELASDIYSRAFDKLQDLIESLLAVSEASFDSSMDMKEFEFQAWFLAFLVQGFTRAKEEVDNADYRVMEELDHRRVTLMLRFENEISDTMELLGEYSFPDIRPSNDTRFNADFTSYFSDVSLSDLEAPRQLLLSLGDTPQLCKMMATMLSVHSANESVRALDKSVLALFRRIVSYFEDACKTMLQGMKIKRIAPNVAFRDTIELCKNISAVLPQFEVAEGWSSPDTLDKDLEPVFLRFNEIETCLRALISHIQEHAKTEEDYSFKAFMGSVFGCGNSSDRIACACLGNSPEDTFLTELPKLRPAHAQLLPQTAFATRKDGIDTTTMENDDIRLSPPGDDLQV